MNLRDEIKRAARSQNAAIPPPVPDRKPLIEPGFRATLKDAATQLNAQLRRVDPEREYLATPAPNAIEWCVGPQFCNSPSLYKYTRSYEVVRDLFQLRCPICNPRSAAAADCWDKTPMYLQSEVLLTWSKDAEDDRCPKCGTTRTEFVEDGLLINYNSLHCVVGQRAGKSVTAALIGTYFEHRFLTIAHGTDGGFHGYLDMTLKDPFEMTFLASNEVQGADTVWAKYRAFRTDAPWFARYVSWVKQEEKMQETPVGMERWEYNETNKRIVNEHPDCKLIINSLNSNSAGLRGRTRIFSGIDELSHMQSGDSRSSADEIFRSIDNSLSTVQSRVKLVDGVPWLGLLVSVSSPLSIHDKAMRLLQEAPKLPSMLAYHYPTWEFNPFEPKANFEERYAKDPVGAERDFGANPPSAAHPLIWNKERFRELSLRTQRPPMAEFSTFPMEIHGHAYVGIQCDHVQRDYGAPRYIAFDAGKNFDAFAGACAHAETFVDDQGATRTRTVFDWVVRILPMPGTEVYYDHVFGLVRELKQQHNIAAVEFDQWNSVQIIQQIRGLGIRAEQHSLRNEDWAQFRTEAYGGFIDLLPPPENEFDGINYLVQPDKMHPHTCALYELEELEEDPITKKVRNPNKGKVRGQSSNDVAQVIVHVNKMVQQATYTAKDGDRSRDAARRRASADSHRYTQGGQGRVFNPTRVMGGRSSGGGSRGW